MRSVVGVGVVDLPLILLPVRIRPVELRRVVDEVVSVQIIILRVGIDPDIGLQIGVRILDGLVDHRHDNVAAALIFLPRVEQVDVGARLSDKHLITRIVVMPLRRQERIVHRHRRTGRSRRGAPQRPGRKTVFQPRATRIFEHLDPAVVAQFADHFTQGKRLVEGNHVPLVQTESAVALLEAGIGAEQRPDAVDPHGREQLVGRGESRTGRRSRSQRGGQRIGGRRTELDDQLSLDGAFGVVDDLHARGRAAALRKSLLRIVRTCRQRHDTCQQQNLFHHIHSQL